MVAITVRDWMTDRPVTVRPGSSLARARSMMRRDEVGRLLVVDGSGRLLGVLTRTDLMEAWPSRFQPLEPFEVRELMERVAVDEAMVTDLVTIEPGATIAEAANLMFEHRIGAVPVVEDGRAVGILTCSDILQGLVRVLSQRDGAAGPR
jgi:acetoin utilization protein AcuB